MICRGAMECWTDWCDSEESNAIEVERPAVVG
jgi:hypothetical protein